ncbi:thioesterase family protein [uncultured Kushneria sp.]|uniref:thioesterase family protein n=1 Tax=uncultured Kushneria sp. TaxID=905033 RepID=UPI002625295F|nr:thioesterase family protein [uncultured Kushneria sp.]
MPLQLFTRHVPHDWVDYNGHMNDAAYALVFSHGVDALMDHIGLDETGRAAHGYTVFTLETHLCYLQQVHEDALVVCDVVLLASDAKRLHLFFTLKDEAGTILSTSEQMLMGIGLQSGRSQAFPEAVSTCVTSLPRLESTHWPEQAGRRIGLR